MRRIVVLGMMAKMPVPGVVWQTLHYLLGLRSLGFDPYYVEAHARTPSMLMERAERRRRRARRRLHRRRARPHGLGDSWAYHALHDDGRCFGHAQRQLRRAVPRRRADHQPARRHGAAARSCADAAASSTSRPTRCSCRSSCTTGRRTTVDFLDAHCAHFTFAENLGTPGCTLPVADRFRFRPTRQPVVLDCWAEPGTAAGPRFTTVANWRQPWRDVRFEGERYGWSKDVEWREVPRSARRAPAPLRAGAERLRAGRPQRLEQRGWRVRDGARLSTDSTPTATTSLAPPRSSPSPRTRTSASRTGWFSDRSATYLAAGRPVITQDTGFGEVLPTGEGLFAVSDLDEAVAAVEAIAADPGATAARPRDRPRALRRRARARGAAGAVRRATRRPT